MLLVKVEGGTNLLCSASFLVIYQCQLPLLQMSVGLGAYLRAPALHVNQGSSASPFGTVWMSAATHVNLCFWAAFAFIHLNQGLVCVSLDLTCVSIKKVSCPAQRLTGFQLQLHHGFVNISCSSASRGPWLCRKQAIMRAGNSLTHTLLKPTVQMPS